MTKKKDTVLVIGVKDEAGLFRETREAFARLDKGLPVQQSRYCLYFEDLTTLWRTMTPKRMELLRALRQHGPLSIKKLAAKLSRDYKNVHNDIQELVAVDLVKQTLDARFTVPWDAIDLQIPLAA